VEAVFGNFLEAEITAKFVDCDYLFLAADAMRARLLFNAIVHQYLIPGVQVGAKVRVDVSSGEVLDAYTVVRPVTSERGASCAISSSTVPSYRKKASRRPTVSSSVILTSQRLLRQA